MNIYEQPWLLLIVAGVVLLAALVFSPKSGKWRLWALAAIIALTAFSVDYSVKTDRELVKSAVAHIVRAAQNEDVNAIARLIADDYRDSYNGTRRLLILRLESRLNEPLIDKNVLRILSLDVNTPNADAVFTVRVVFDPQGSVYDFQKQMLFKFEADLVKQGDDWYFSRIELVELDMHPLDWKHIPASVGEIFD